MTKHYDRESPVHSYLRRGSTHNLPVPRHLTPAAVNTPQFQQYLAFVKEGDPRELAQALVEGRLDALQHRRDMVNYLRSFINLSPRPMSPAKQIADVTRQLTELYRQATEMIRAKNDLADALIDQATKTGKLELEQATYEAKIAEQRRLRDGFGVGRDPSPHERLAKIAAAAKERYPAGSLERRKWLRLEELSHTHASLEQIEDALGNEFDEEVKATITRAGIRLD